MSYRIVTHQPIVEERCTRALYFPNPADYLRHLQLEGDAWLELEVSGIPADLITAHSQLGFAGAEVSIDIGWAIDLRPLFDGELPLVQTEAVNGYIN